MVDRREDRQQTIPIVPGTQLLLKIYTDRTDPGITPSLSPNCVIERHSAIQKALGVAYGETAQRRMLFVSKFFGLTDGNAMSAKDIGEEHGIRANRAYEIIRQGINTLRHPTARRGLDQFQIYSPHSLAVNILDIWCDFDFTEEGTAGVDMPRFFDKPIDELKLSQEAKEDLESAIPEKIKRAIVKTQTGATVIKSVVPSIRSVLANVVVTEITADTLQEIRKIIKTQTGMETDSDTHL